MMLADGLTAVILCDGKNKRIALEKALINVNGTTIIKRTYDICCDIFSHTIIITSKDEIKAMFPESVIYNDIICNSGSVGGIYSGLVYAQTDYCFVFACDMPFINKKMIIKQLEIFKENAGADVLIPYERVECKEKIEPLHCIYSKNCISPIKKRIDANNFQIKAFFDDVNVVYCEYPEELKRSFFNINTKEDLMIFQHESY